MLKGGRRLGAANYLYVNGTSPLLYSAQCLNPVCACVCVSLHVYVIKGRGRSFFENDMYGADSHLFGGSFQTVETMLLHFATITPA